MTNDHPLNAYILQPGEGVPGFATSVKASRASTGNTLTLIESRTSGGAPLHVHRNEDEYLYVLEGAISVRCGDQTAQVEAHGFIFLPRGIPHSWDVIGEEATVLMMTVPAMLAEFLQEFHAASGEARHQIAEKYGITFV